MSTEPLSFEPESTEIQRSAKQGEELRQSEEVFSLLVASVKDYAIFMLDPQGNVMTWNEGAQRIKGYKPNEIIGKHFSTFYTEEAKARNHPQYELEIAVKEGRYEEEGWRIRKDGSTFWANVVITAVTGKNGKLTGFAKVTRDLTERRHTEEQREMTAKALAESNEELQHLAYIVSHELQAPISTISRYCNLLMVRYKDKLGEDANDFMSKMSEASSLIARMIDDLWTYARITKPNQEHGLVDVKHVLNDAIAELKNKVDDDEVRHGELPSIYGNRPQLTYLFKELILNAVKYRSSKPPKIEISATEDQGGWLFAVNDNGIGIDGIYSREVFKIFHRLSQGPEAESTGMGLAICMKIVQHHDGRIWFESNGTGQGTTFYVWLPIPQEQPQARASTQVK